MSSNNKGANFKEKLRQALLSTFKVISDELGTKDHLSKNNDTKKFDFLNLENVNTKKDLIKARADSDTSALKKKIF